jgi:hypothetical protein
MGTEGRALSTDPAASAQALPTDAPESPWLTAWSTPAALGRGAEAHEPDRPGRPPPAVEGAGAHRLGFRHVRRSSDGIVIAMLLLVVGIDVTPTTDGYVVDA